MSQLNAMMSSGPLPPSRNRRSISRRIVLGVILLCVVGLIWGGFSVMRTSTTTSDYVGAGTGEVVVLVERGDSLRVIAERLRSADVILSVDAFLTAVNAEERASGIGPGKYTMRKQMSGSEALALMLDSTSRELNQMVLPEGLTLDETVAIASKTTGLSKANYKNALKVPNELGLPTWAASRPEGFMFPATYDLSGDETAADVLRVLVQRFGQASSDVGLESRAGAVGRTPYEVLIVASLLQAEGLPNDFAKVARVIYNRLDTQMPLQLDSTVSYALGINDIVLNEDQLATDSPYNTYIYKGLPPTPINSPGEAAIDSALAPAKGKWLYFVTIDPENGVTKFTKSYDKFLKLKAEFQDNLAKSASE
ncbi:MAG: endolytic transglycosylase MltG [Candidatus Nanopelagicales bacterium]|nr:endolytic transglycosylase MltG [Candidatus Nanopelagicales bacterium]